MNRDDYFSLGYIKKPVKHEGELIVFLDVDNPANYRKLNGFFVEMPTGLVPFFIEHIQIRESGDAVVKLEGIDDEESAAALKGKAVWMPVDSLPKLTGNKFYYHEIIGWEVVDKNVGAIGTVKDVLDNGAQPLFQVIHPTGKEILVPIHDDILNKVDRTHHTLYITSPVGLLDLYL